MKLQKRWMGILLSMYLVAGSVQAKDVLPIGESVRLTTEPTRAQRFAVAPVQVNGEQLPAYGIRVPSPGLDEETLSFTPEQTILQSSATAAQLQRLAVYAFDGSWFLVPRDWILKYAELGVNGSDGWSLLLKTVTGCCVTSIPVPVSVVSKERHLLFSQKLGAMHKPMILCFTAVPMYRLRVCACARISLLIRPAHMAAELMAWYITNATVICRIGVWK